MGVSRAVNVPRGAPWNPSSVSRLLSEGRYVSHKARPARVSCPEGGRGAEEPVALPCWGRKRRPGRRESLALTVKPTPPPRSLLHSPPSSPPHATHSQHQPCNYAHPPSETVCLADVEKTKITFVLFGFCFALFSSVTSAEYPLSGAFCRRTRGVKRGNVCVARARESRFAPLSREKLPCVEGKRRCGVSGRNK